MKNLLLIAALALGCAAQTPEAKKPPGVLIGIQGGIGTVKKNNRPEINGSSSSIESINVGMNTTLKLTHFVWIAIEANYLTMENQLGIGVPPCTVSCTGLIENREYIAFPIQGIFRLPSGRVSPFVSLGMAPSFNVSATEEVRMLYTSHAVKRIDLRDEPDFRKNFSIFDLPVILGIGATINFHRVLLFAGVQYSLGTMSFVKRSEGDVDLRHDAWYTLDEQDQKEDFKEYFNVFRTQLKVAYKIGSESSRKCTDCDDYSYNMWKRER